MTIGTAASSVTLAGNGATTVWSFGFVGAAASDLVVTITNAAGVQVVLGQSQYSVALNAPVAGQIWGVGGTVTYPLSAAPLPAGSTITIQRILPLTQTTSISNQGNFYPEAVEAALDTLCMENQQTAFTAGRAILINPADRVAPQPLPVAAVRAGKFLGFDSNGQPTLLTGTLVPPGSAITTVINIRDYGAVGDGVTDDSGAVQQAFNAAGMTGTAVWVPPASPGYLINHPINLTNLAIGIRIFGCGMAAPAFNQALSSPARGSIFLGNTGSGLPVFDCAGSINVIFDSLTISTLGCANPSSVSIIFGTSTTAAAVAAPGGANCGCRDVAILMTNSVNSTGLAFIGGAGPYTLDNVWALAKFPCVMSSNNITGILSPFVTFVLGLGIDGVTATSCAFLGYGTTALQIEGSAAHTWAQLYVVTIVSGPGYTGTANAIIMNNVTSIDMNVECDFYPGVLFLQGAVDGLRIKGTAFAGPTPVGPLEAIFVFFSGTLVKNSTFQLSSGTGVPSNYFYTTDGATPTELFLANCEFDFDAGISSNVAFFNVTSSGPTVPFLNLRFNGNTDAVTISTLINGSPAGPTQMRYFLNGRIVGTA